MMMVTNIGRPGAGVNFVDRMSAENPRGQKGLDIVVPI